MRNIVDCRSIVEYRSQHSLYSNVLLCAWVVARLSLLLFIINSNAFLAVQKLKYTSHTFFAMVSKQIVLRFAKCDCSETVRQLCSTF